MRFPVYFAFSTDVKHRAEPKSSTSVTLELVQKREPQRKFGSKIWPAIALFTLRFLRISLKN